MYKDKDRQREANRKAQAKQRAKRITDGMVGLIKGMTKQGMTKEGGVIPEGVTLPPDVVRSIDRISDSPEEHKRRTAAALRYQRLFPDRPPILDQDFTIAMAGAGKANLPVSKPGDEDYDGVCLQAKYKDRWIR